MRRIFISLFLLLFLTRIYSFSQVKDNLELYKLPTRAFVLYKNKDYQNAASLYTILYKESFKRRLYNQNTFEAAYNGACSWALANKPDSAFITLNEVADKDLFLMQYPHILQDGDLVSLHSDRRWDPLIKKIENHKKVFESGLDKNLVSILDSLRINDQQYRLAVAKKAKEFGVDSKEVKDEWKLINKHDSINLVQIKELIMKYGWLGPRKVGFRGSTTCYLVIQHADLATQEKYFPIMKRSVKQGNASAADLAFLEDRILLRQGKMQLYGSQLNTLKNKDDISYPKKLQDPDNVDSRRFNVGLESMAEYLAPDKWDPTEYKKLYQDIK
jgi:hypothetical protein